eukprot:g11192.t1
MGTLVEALPAEEQAEWDRVFDGEMKAAFHRFQMNEKRSPRSHSAHSARSAALPTALAEKAEDRDSGSSGMVPKIFVRADNLSGGLGRKQQGEAAPNSKGMLELSRTMLVFVVSFSVPVAGMYVYRAVKQASRGTDLDAAFLSLGEP